MSEDSSHPVLEKAKVPFPDAAYATRSTTRLTSAALPGSGLGDLANVVSWAGRVQATAEPVAFQKIQAIVVSGDYAGGFAAGEPDGSSRDVADIIDRLADRAGVPIERIDTGPGRAAEEEAVLTDDEYTEAITRGAEIADRHIDSGVDALVLIGSGPGTTAAAVAVTAHISRTPFVDLSPRIQVPGGLFDDNTWMQRVAATRDAFARVGESSRKARDTLSQLGGRVLATMTGLIVAAGLRRTPVLFDGPVAAASALAARDFSLGAPKWCYAPDRIPHPVVEKVAAQVGMSKPIGPGLDIGEGCAVLHVLPQLQDALRLASALPYPASD